MRTRTIAFPLTVAPATGCADAETDHRDVTDRVRVFPSPNGTFTMVGTTLDNEWVVELQCLDLAMGLEDAEWVEQRVLAYEAMKRKRRLTLEHQSNGNPAS